MKFFIAYAVFLAVAMAEPPPSNSYLPPAPNQRSSAGYSGGYPSGGAANGLPQVVAARSGQFGFTGKEPQGIAGRSPSQGYAGRNPSQGYEQSAAALARNALEQQNQEPASYNFEYMVNDYEEGAEFGHQEERENESARGEYHVVLPDGRRQTVTYEADERGFKPRISYEETDSFSRSAGAGGYDANAQNGARSHAGNGGHGYQ